jgi:hypothetical protein
MADNTRARITLAATDATGPAFNSLSQRLAGAAGDVAGLATRFAALGGVAAALAGFTFLTTWTKGVAEGLDKLNDLRDATGASIENLAGLESTATRAGVSFDSVAQTLLKFNKALASSDDPKIAAVFDAIGLSVKNLKQQDPVQALLATAQAFDRFAADGSRARAEQEIFGKSLREIAPALRKLAEEGLGNAGAIAEQARAADQFNDNLALMAQRSTETARALGGPLLQAFNDLFAAVEKARADPRGFFTGFVEKTGVGHLRKGLGEVNLQLKNEFEQNQKDLAELAKPSDGALSLSDSLAKAFAADRVRDYAQLTAAAEKYRSEIDRILYAGGSRRPANEGGGRVIPRTLGDTAPAKKPEISDFDKYIERLRESLRATQNLTEAEKVRVDEAEGKLGKLTNDQRDYAFELARVLDLAKAPAAFVGPEIAADLLAKRKKDAEELQRLIDASQAAKFDALVAGTQNAIEAMRQGTITTEEYRRATESLGKEFEALEPKFEKMATFAQQAAASIQSTLGTAVEDVLAGKFNSIGKLWANMLRQMAAQALTAQLGQALLGDFAKTGKVGGGLGSLFDWASTTFGGARASGGPVQAGRAYVVGEQGPEVMVAGASGVIVPNHALGGPSFTFAPQIVANGDVSPQTLAAIRGEVARMHQRYMRQLSVSGA